MGHTDWNDVRWQVVDTPGLLDRPLEERNAIEMQAIAALAHLEACVLFFFDPSESGGYTLAEQNNLFVSVQALFKHKPFLLVATKADMTTVEDLTALKRSEMCDLEQLIQKQQ